MVQRTVLVIEGRSTHNWAEIFARVRPEKDLRVLQYGWDALSATAYGYGNCMVRAQDVNSQRVQTFKMTDKDMV